MDDHPGKVNICETEIPERQNEKLECVVDRTGTLTDVYALVFRICGYLTLYG